MSCLIRIYTVPHSGFDVTIKPQFSIMDMSKFKFGRVLLRHLGVKGLGKWTASLKKCSQAYAPCADSYHPALGSIAQLIACLTAYPRVRSFNPHLATYITKTHLFKYIENFTFKN